MSLKIRSLAHLWPVLLALSLAGCGPSVTVSDPLVRPTTSTSATDPAQATKLRFLRNVNVRDHAVNQYNFWAGTEFVKNGLLNDGGGLYCGLFGINGDLRPFHGCIGVRGNSITLGLGSALKEVTRELPASSLELLAQ